MTTQEMITVLQAHEQGKPILHRPICGKTWAEVFDPTWDFTYWAYRVAPQPREWEINLGRNGQVYDSRAAYWDLEGREKIKVREVL